MKKIIKLTLIGYLFGAACQVYSQGFIVSNGVVANLISGAISVANNPAYPPGSGGPFTGFSLRSQSANTFQFSTFADTGVRVFLVSSGDTISLQPILMNSYPELTFSNTYTFGNASPFFVGLFTGSGFPQNGIYTDPLFGWAKLENIGGTIQLLDSALEYGGQGIFAGTQNILVPEPSVLALSVVGSLLLGWRLRRKG